MNPRHQTLLNYQGFIQNQEGQDIKQCANTISSFFQSGLPKQIQVLNSMQALYKLCQNRSKVRISQVYGTKQCLLCSGANFFYNQKGLKQPCNLLECNTKLCNQTYHISCIFSGLEQIILNYSNSIERVRTIEELSFIQIEASFFCLVCSLTPTNMPQDILDYTKKSIDSLEELKVNRKQQIWDKVTQEKFNLGKCGVCNFQWIQNGQERKLYYQDLLDEKIYKNELGKSKIRLDKCNHIFCINCLSDTFTKSILKDQYLIKCPIGNCKQDISYSQLQTIFSSRYHFFLKYKNYLLTQSLKKIKDKILFVVCPGVYKINQQNCENIPITDNTVKISLKKEIVNLRQQGIIDLSNLNSLKDQNKVMLCNKVYQVNIEDQVDMKKHFENELNLIENQNEKEEMGQLFQQYLESRIITKEELDNQADKQLIICESKECDFNFCIKGCLEDHPNNVCPFLNKENLENRTVIPIERVVKDIGGSHLYYGGKDNQIVTPQNQFCFKCFQTLQLSPQKKKEDQISLDYFVKCKCYNEK